MTALQARPPKMEPWENDPIVKPAAEAEPWRNDPIITPGLVNRQATTGSQGVNPPAASAPSTLDIAGRAALATIKGQAQEGLQFAKDAPAIAESAGQQLLSSGLSAVQGIAAKVSPWALPGLPSATLSQSTGLSNLAAGSRMAEGQIASGIQSGNTPYTPAWFARQMIQSSPQMAAVIAAGIMTGGVGAFGMGALLEGGNIASDVYQKELAAGKSESEASDSAFQAMSIYGPIAGVLEQVAPGHILGGGGFVRRAGGAAIAEGITEPMQGAAQALTTAGVTGQPMQPDFWDQRLQEAAAAAATGGFVGAVTPNLAHQDRPGQAANQEPPAPVVDPANQSSANPPLSDKGASNQTTSQQSRSIVPQSPATNRPAFLGRPASSVTPSVQQRPIVPQTAGMVAPPLSQRANVGSTAARQSPLPEVGQSESQVSSVPSVDLTQLSYRDLRAKAKAAGIDARGSRRDLIARLSPGHGVALAATEVPRVLAKKTGRSLESGSAGETGGDARGLRPNAQVAARERGQNSVLASSDSNANLFDAESLAKQIHSKINVPSGTADKFSVGMLARVLRRSKDREVLNSVIALIPVDVMNDLVAAEPSAKMGFHDSAMLANVLLSPKVPHGVVVRVLRAMKRADASAATKDILDAGKVAGLSGNLNAAPQTSHSDARASSKIPARTTTEGHAPHTSVAVVALQRNSTSLASGSHAGTPKAQAPDNYSTPTNKEGTKPEQKGKPLPDSQLTEKAAQARKPVGKMTDAELTAFVADPDNATTIPFHRDQNFALGLARAQIEKRAQNSIASEVPMIARRSGIESKLDDVEAKAKERIKLRARPAGKTKRGIRGGSAPLFGDIADTALIVAARAAKLGIKGYKKIRSLVELVVNESSPHLKSSVDRIAKQAHRLFLKSRTNGEFDPEKFDREAATLIAKAEVTDRRRTGETIKSKIAEESGPKREPLTVTESEALKAKIKARSEGSKIGAKQNAETNKLVNLVRKLKWRKLRRDFLETVDGGDALFKDKGHENRIRDVARFLRKSESSGLVGVHNDTLALAESLDAKKLQSLTPDEAESLRRMTRAFKAMATGWDKMHAEAKTKSFKAAASEALADVESVKPLDTGSETPKNRGFLKHWAVDVFAMPDVRALITGAGKIIHRVFYSNLVDGQNRALSLEREARERVQKVMNEQGITPPVLDRLRTKYETVDLGGGRSIKMTRAEMMAFYALWNRADARAKITKNGFKALRFRNLLDPHNTYRADDPILAVEMANKIISRLTPSQRAVVEAGTLAIAEVLKPRGNVTSRLLFGNPLFEEADYTLPIRTELADKQRNLEPDSMGFSKQWLEDSGFTIETVKHKHPILIGDYFTELYGHMQSMAAFAEIAPSVRDALKLLGHPEFGSAMRERYGLEWEKQMLRTLAKLSGTHREPRTSLESLASTLNRNLAVGKLGLRLTTYLANRLGGLTLAAAYLSPKENAALSGFSGRALAGIDAGGFLPGEKADLAKLETNGYLYHRWHVESYRLGAPGFEDVGTWHGKIGSLREKWHRMQNVLTAHMRYAECRNAVAVYRAIVAAGSDEATAIQRVSDITRKTQNPVTALEESPFVDAVKKNPLAALAFMFTSQINVSRNMLQRAIVEGDGKALAATTISVSANIVIMLAVRELWRMFKAGFEEEDKNKQRDAIDHATAAAAEAADLFAPGAGDVLSGVVRSARGKSVYNRNAITEIVDATNTVARQSVKAASVDTGKDGLEVAWRLVKAMGTIVQGAGVPLPSALEVGEGIYNVVAPNDEPEAKPTAKKKPARPKRLTRPRRPAVAA